MNNQTGGTSRAIYLPVGKALRFFNVLAIIAFSVLIFSCKSNSDQSQQPAAQHADTTAAALQSMTEQYNATKMQLDQVLTQKNVADSQLSYRNAEIAKLTGEVNKLKKNNRALSSKLKKDNNLLASLRDEMNDKARSFAERIGLLEADKSNLSRQRDSLMTRYNDLKALGSVLHASNIRLAALHLKHHGKKEKKTGRARKTDVLRVYFDIDENRIAEDGNKELYLVIKDPQGNLLAKNNGTSAMMNLHGGDATKYTMEKQIFLKQNQPVDNLTADWTQDDDYKKGAYSIAIYNGGYKIGGGQVVLN